MTSRLKVLYLLSKYPWEGGKVQDGEYVCFQCTFWQQFLLPNFSILTLQYSLKKEISSKQNSQIQQKDSLKIYRIDGSCCQIFNSRDSPTLQKDILTIYLPIRCIMSSNLQFAHVQMTFSWYKKGHIPLPKLSSHIPSPHSIDPLLLRTR